MTDDTPAPGQREPGEAVPVGPDASAPDAEAPAKEWWDDPAMPWRHKPSRADIVCLTVLGAAGVYGLVMLPLRPVMIELTPHLLGSLGYRTGLIMTGALAAVGDRWWPLVLAIGSLAVIKFHWIYWWAGRLWGREILDVLARDKWPRTKALYEKAWQTTHRYEVLALVLTFLPLPIPGGVVFAALGAAGTSLRKFLIVSIAASLVTTAAYMYAGFLVGEPAVQLMDAYGRYLWYVSLAILVGMIALAVWRVRRPAAN